MTNQTVEQRIQELMLNAPRIPNYHIDNCIVSETYTVLPSGKTMVCELMLKNGYGVTGESSVVSKANFNEEIGKAISRKNARDKIWMLEGYLLQESLYQQALKPE